jgi:hypothetical protein
MIERGRHMAHFYISAIVEIPSNPKRMLQGQSIGNPLNIFSRFSVNFRFAVGISNIELHVFLSPYLNSLSLAKDLLIWEGL